jgi:hypothetical protein
MKRDVSVSERRWCWYVLWNVTPCVLVNACRRLQGTAVLRNLEDVTSRHGVKFIGAFAIFRKATVRFVMSVRLSTWNNSAPSERIFMKFDFGIFFEKLLRIFKFHYNRTWITGTVHEDQYTFFIVSRLFTPRMINISYQTCRENQNTLFRLNNVLK